LIEQPEYRNQRFFGEALVWGHPRLTTNVFGCTFEQCHITVACPSQGLMLGDSVFRHCTIVASRPHKDHQFFDVGFENCSFHGRYPGCEFGFREPSIGQLRGYVTHSNFRAAQLDMVAINSSDPASLLFPAWPHIVLVDPATTIARLASEEGDPHWRFLAGLGISPSTTALVLLYHAFNGRVGFRTSPEVLLSRLQGFPGVSLDRGSA